MQEVKMRTCLWFDGKAREAAEFYATVFPDSRVERRRQARQRAHRRVHLGQPCFGLNAGPHFKPNEAVGFQVYTDDPAETERCWNAIVDNGGKVSDCDW